MRKAVEAGTFVEDEDLDNQEEGGDASTPKTAAVKKERKVRKTKSLKKQIAEMGLKVREDIGAKVQEPKKR